MRVQPHLPRSPFTATVMERLGSAWFACSAANRPAPPEPRIRMSVFSRRMCINIYHRGTEKKENTNEIHVRLEHMVSPGPMEIALLDLPRCLCGQLVLTPSEARAAARRPRAASFTSV